MLIGLAALIAVIGHCEARSLYPQQVATNNQNLAYLTPASTIQRSGINELNSMSQGNGADSDDDDEDDLDMKSLLNSVNQADQAATDQQLSPQQQQYLQSQIPAASPSSVDLKTSASHHGHHGHHAKGWLDMGAWTGKKGAFGWYDKHPVGKGK